MNNTDKSDALVTWVETCRDLGRGALCSEDLARDGLPGAIELEAALDIFDRQIDNILGRIKAASGPALPL